MSQRTVILAEILGVRGWKVKEIFFEDDQGERFELLAGYELMPDLRMVLRAERQWAPRCSGCGAICRHAAHEKLPARRWRDLSWAGRPVELEASLICVFRRDPGSRSNLTRAAVPTAPGQPFR